MLTHTAVGKPSILVSTIPWLGTRTVQMEKGNLGAASIGYSLFSIADAIWATALRSCSLDFLIMTDSNLNGELEHTPSPLHCLCQGTLSR